MEGLKNKTVIVTGGAGFIGSHLSYSLVNSGAKVIVIDISINPKSFYIQSGVHKGTNLILSDVRDKNQIFEIFKSYNPEYVFHLAAEPIVETGYENPHATLETNIMGTVNVLEAVRKNRKIKGLIVASSDKAYGKTKKAYTEKSALSGDHPYDVSKSAADLICNAYFKTYEIPVVVTRFGNVYGEGDLHFDRIIPGICKAIINDQLLKIRSDGTYVRDYIYVKDVTNGYLLLLKNINKIKGEAFNFSSTENLSVLNLINRIEKITGKKIPFKIFNSVKNEIPYQHLNDSKVRKLGWKTSSNLESTIDAILKWYSRYEK